MMINKIKLSLSNLISEEGLREKMCLLNFLDENKPSLTSLLMDYYFLKRGLVIDVRVKESSVDFKDKISGHFILQYKVSYTLGCSDNSYTDKAEMNINFLINLEGNFIELSGDVGPGRDPDEI